MENKEVQQKKMGIITYNRIGDGQYENGWVEGEGVKVYVLQNSHKPQRAAPLNADSETQRKIRKNSITYLLEDMNPVLKELDHLYLYVGKNGAEEGIRLTKNLSEDKITYIMCDCNYYMKKSLISQLGHKSAKIGSCECGGDYTLENILKDLIVGRKPSLNDYTPIPRKSWFYESEDPEGIIW